MSKAIFARKIDREKYESDLDQRRLIINSDDRVYGSSSKFRIMLNSEYNGLKTIRLIACTIPNTLYVFTDNPAKPTNTITLLETAQPDAIITIPNGTYNIVQICAELASLLTAASPSGSVYTVTYSQITNKITVTSTITTFQLFFDLSNSPYIPLGYNYDVAYPTVAALSHTAPNVYNLTGAPYLIIKIGNIQDVVQTTFNISGNYYVPMQAEYGYVNYYQPQNDSDSVQILDDVNNTITYFDVGLVDDNGNFVDLNGSEWSFTLSMTFY